MSNKLKILFIIESLRRGGKERQLIELIKQLVGRGYVITVVVFDSTFAYAEINGLNINILKKNGINLFKSIFKLFTIIKKTKPKIIHSWSALTTLLIYPAAKRYNVKLIDSIRYAKSIKPLSKKWFISNLAFLLSDRVVANSNAGLKTHHKVYNRKYKVIYNGYECHKKLQLSDIVELKKKLGIKKKYVVGMVATFHPGKDYKSFIEAGKKILEERSDVCFMCIGEGLQKSELENSIEEKYRSFFSFTGKRDDVESIIEIFDVGVLLSNINVSAEGISNALTEIMAARKPVIATNAGGNRELITNDKDGFLIDAFAVEQLANKIKLLIDNDNLRTEMGQLAREKIQHQFSVEKMVNSYLNTYQGLVR